MKRKTLSIKLIAIVSCCVMLTGVLSSCKNSAITNKAQIASAEPTANSISKLDLDVEPTPVNYNKLAKDLKSIYEKNTDDLEVALAYAEKLLQLGNVEEAEAVIKPIYKADSTNPQVILLMAQAAYLKGDYDNSEALYNLLLKDYPEYRTEAEFGIQFVYYQTNQYKKANLLSEDCKSATGIRELMQAYGDKEPYRVTWDNKHETTIPFVVSEPLPVVELEINGKKRNFIIDTGASDTYLNESVAKEFGLETVSTQTAPYAGGITVVTNYGIVDSLHLGGVTLENIPVNFTNMDHLANIAGEEYEISGVIGIGVFKQFLVTIDYINSELILKPRGEHLVANSNAYEAPFIMAGLHFTLCKAELNGKTINAWTDSGLAADESLLLTDGAIEYIGIPVHEIEEEDDDESGEGGLGGADFTVGGFVADTYKMGNMPTAHGMKGLSGVIVGSGYEEEFKVFMDCIISHNYLKEYKWTMDFDSMTMTFE